MKSCSPVAIRECPSFPILNTAGPLASRLVANTNGFSFALSTALSPWMWCVRDLLLRFNLSQHWEPLLVAQGAPRRLLRAQGALWGLSFYCCRIRLPYQSSLPMICFAGRLSRSCVEERVSLVEIVDTSSLSSTATQTSVSSDKNRIKISFFHVAWTKLLSEAKSYFLAEHLKVKIVKFRYEIFCKSL